ncbi:MAG: TrmH family RNA methyltransferase [Anaerolineales bacterium]
MMITSTKNPSIQWVRRLQKKPRFRVDEKVFVIEGVRLVEEALRNHWEVKSIFYSESLSARGRQLLKTYQEYKTQIDPVSLEVMQAISDTKSPQGILAVVRKQELPLQEPPNFLLVLDQIRDPGNLGTILRTAAATGVQAVFLTPGTVDAFSPKVLRAGMGAQFRLPILSMEWSQIQNRVVSSKLHVFLAAPQGGNSYYESNFRQPLALIIGGEAEGAAREAIKLSNSRVKIPMLEGIESLNASVAAGILLSEVLRQRKKVR